MEPSPEPSALRREVLSPRGPLGLWAPVMALGATAMLTLVSAIAVMAPRPHHLGTIVHEAPAPVTSRAELVVMAADVEAQVRTLDRQRELCRGPIYRATPDGRAESYEECVAVPGTVTPWIAAPGLAAALPADRIAGCLTEWAERTGGTAARVTLAARVDAQGRLSATTVTGLVDRVVPRCLSGVLRDVSYVTEPAPSAVELELRYDRGTLRATARALEP